MDRQNELVTYKSYIQLQIYDHYDHYFITFCSYYILTDKNQELEKYEHGQQKQLKSV